MSLSDFSRLLFVWDIVEPLGTLLTVEWYPEFLLRGRGAPVEEEGVLHMRD